MNPSPLTPQARGAIYSAQDHAKRLQTDLMALNVSLTARGNGTVAERLAHTLLLDVLAKQQIATDALNGLTEAVKE